MTLIIDTITNEGRVDCLPSSSTNNNRREGTVPSFHNRATK